MTRFRWQELGDEMADSPTFTVAIGRKLSSPGQAMSTSPADMPEPVRGSIIRKPLAGSRLRVSVELRDKRPLRRRRIDPRWVLLAMMFVGLIQGSYFFWAGRSALAAAPVFHGDESCKAPKLDSLRNIAGHACRLEAAVVVAATYSSGRSGQTYRLTTVSVDGSREYTSLAGAQSIALWGRLHPTERVVLQRFVAPGYYLTGRITAVADSVGSGMTRYHPDSGTHFEAMLAAVGFLISACTFAICFL